jgi:P2-related tail formation protein
MGEKRNASKISVVKPEATAWNLRNVWENTVEIYLKCTEWWESVYTRYRYTCLSIGTSSTLL